MDDDPTAQRDLSSQMERAAAEFDRRTATAFGRALLDSLCEDPGNLRQLEALIILGLAHPDVLGQNRISLAVEGRRLAVLLERSGQMDRARGVLELLANRMPEERTIDHELAGMMRRSGNTDQLVDRYMRRAEQAIAQGKTSEAIPWLQEVLLLDRTRRDVARMIRDLRYHEADRTTSRRKRNKLLVVLASITAVVTIAIGREVSISKELKGISVADAQDHAGLQARRASLQSLLDSHRVWTGVVGVREEITQIDEQIARIEKGWEAQADQVAEQHAGLIDRANTARMHGLMLSEKADFEGALNSFNEALEFAPKDWEHRMSVEKDAKALNIWKAANQ